MNIKKIISLAFVVSLGFIVPAQSVFAVNDLGSLSETVSIGKTISVGLNSSATGSWFIFSNSNSSIASGSINGNTLVVKSLAPGSTTIQICTETIGSHCLSLAVNSVQSELLGVSTVSETSPVGSWVIQNQTVYYIHSLGLIPVTTWKIFLSNGGKAKLIKPIKVNDSNLPLLSFMTAKDVRLVK